MLEADYQMGLIKRIERHFPGCFVWKNDTAFRQGIPDLVVLFGPYWAVLEVKPETPTSESDFEPNQIWYLNELSKFSFAACIYPENEKEVLNALAESFGA